MCYALYMIRDAVKFASGEIKKGAKIAGEATNLKTVIGCLVLARVAIKDVGIIRNGGIRA